jgi:hypothetical protein
MPQPTFQMKICSGKKCLNSEPYCNHDHSITLLIYLILCLSYLDFKICGGNFLLIFVLLLLLLLLVNNR